MSKGIYLSSPHGRLIRDGDKTLIAVAKRLPIEGERVVCSKEDGEGLAYGVAVIGDPSVVDIETFDDQFQAHRVPRASRLKWWPGAQHLYLYPIRYFAPFPTPKPIKVPPGTTMDMSAEVKFLEEQEVSTEQPPFDDETNLVIMSSSDTIQEEKAMPVDVKVWKPSDALRHTKKADTPKKQEQWAATANSRLAACKKEGGDPKECEASAIRVANAAVAKAGEKQRSALPDSAFLYIEPGGKKVDGKTKPDSLRHLPYRKADGSLDLPRLRNALSRLGQPATGTGQDGWLTPALRKRLQSKARNILKNARGKALADLLATEDDSEALTAIKSMAAYDDLILLTETKAGDDGDGERAVCTCPSCKEEADGESDIPCKEMECPGCGAKMRGGAEEDEEEKAIEQLKSDLLQIYSREQIVATLKEVMGTPGDESELEKKGKVAVQEEEEDASDEEEEEKPKEEKAGRRFSTSILAKLRKLGESITELIQHGEYADKQPEPDPVAQIATQLSKGFKTLGVDSQGRTWFMIWPTNSYYDREGEAFETKAINDYVDRHADQEVKGETWFWHVPGSKFGTIREQAVVGDHFVCQLGTYDDTPIGNAFKSFFAKYPDSHPTIAPNGWGASHKYDYILEDRKDNIYEFFDIQESTVLPLDAAANVFNPHPMLGGFKMNDVQKAAISNVGESLGISDLVDQITARADTLKEELDAKGVERKEVEEEQPPAQSEDSTPEINAPDAVKAIAEALQLDSLSKMLEGINNSVKSITERLDTLETTVGRTEEEIKAQVADELPRYNLAWFQPSQQDETVREDKEIKTLNSDSSLPLPLQGLVNQMQRQL